MDCKMLISRNRKQRGAVLIVSVAFLVAVIAVASLSIGVSYLYYKHVQAQKAADTAALAGAYELSKGASSATAVSEALTIAAANGYNPATDSNVTVTTHYPYNNDNSIFNVSLTRKEPMFFGVLFGENYANVGATSSALSLPYNPMQQDPVWYGRIGGPMNYAAYGPDNGADRGDSINTKWTAIDGLFPKLPNPTYSAAGLIYYLNLPADYATRNGTTLLDVEIYDPDIYEGGNTHGRYDETTTYNTTSEKWRYSLYQGNALNPNSVNTLIASQVYGETDTDRANTNDRWVTPTGFQIDSSVYGNYYYVQVTSDDGSGNLGTGEDENGFLLRAGPPHPELNHVTVSGLARTDLSDPYQTDNWDLHTSPNYGKTVDTLWENSYGSNPGSPNVDAAGNPIKNGTQMGEVTNSSVNCNALVMGTTLQLYFGYAPPAASGDTIIIFNGFDEDSGASAVYYTCDTILGSNGQPIKFTGVLGGNGIWSPIGAGRGISAAATPSNTIDMPTTDNYKGGNWTVWYTTGPADNTTWNWQTNTSLIATSPHINLVSTGVNQVY